MKIVRAKGFVGKTMKAKLRNNNNDNRPTTLDLQMPILKPAFYDYMTQKN